MRTLLLTLLLSSSPALAADFEAQEIDPHAGDVVYALTTTDVNGDGQIDVVALTDDAVVWYENPSWTRHEELKGQTGRTGPTGHDNVCLQAHDINGDGRMDFALGADWNPGNTSSGGSLQWLRQEEDGSWTVIPIATEPTIHRMRWADVGGSDAEELIVAPLQGRDTKGPDWGEGNGTRLMVFTVPDDPSKDEWPMEVAEDSLHTMHNLWPVDFDGDGKDELIVAAWEGVFLLDRDDDGRWTRTKLGAGNQEAAPNKGASEIKLGHLADGRPYIATIEPWHGFQVVVYTPQVDARELWNRRVVDEPLSWGHAVWVDDLDGDGADELVIGQRDPNRDGRQARDGTTGPGVFVYDPIEGSSPLEFRKQVIDDGGVAVEDAMTADLDGDGRPEIIAGGRATHNVKIYWNRGGESAK